MHTQIPSSAPSRPEHGPSIAAATIEASQLFHGRQEITIRHNGAYYRLRITKNGKLILTK